MWADRSSTMKPDVTGEAGPDMAEDRARLTGAAAAVFENFSSGAARPLRWTPDAVHRLYGDVDWALKSNPTGAAEVAGLLLAKSDHTVEIVDCQPVFLMQEGDHPYAIAGPGRREFARALAAVRSIPEDELSVIGLYRSKIGDGLDITQEDLGLIRTCFRDSNAVLLLMKLAWDGSSSVRLFSGDEGQLLSEFRSTADESGLPRWLELWQNLSAEAPLTTAGPENATEITERTEVAVRTTERERALIRQLADVELAEIEGPLRRRRGFLVALATIFLVGMGFLIFDGPASLKHGSGSYGPAAGQAQTSSSHYAAFALRVEKQGDELRVDWDRTAPVLSAATGGMLTMRAGNAAEKQVLLDVNLLRTGAVIYRPVHGDVFLRLVIFGPNGRNVGESVATYPQRVSASRGHP
jgi:hypothetical protein